MKPLFTILILFLCLNLQAQYRYTIPNPNYSKRDAIITASTIGVTFLTLEIRGNQMTGRQRNITATSGIGFALGYSIFQSTDLSRKIQHRIKMKRNKSINYKPELIYDK